MSHCTYTEQKSPYECHENMVGEKSDCKQKQQQQGWLQCHRMLRQRHTIHSADSSNGGSSDDEEYDDGDEWCCWPDNNNKNSHDSNSCDNDDNNDIDDALTITDDANVHDDNDGVLASDDVRLTVSSLTYCHETTTASPNGPNKINRESKSVSSHRNLLSMPMPIPMATTETSEKTVTHFDSVNMTAAVAAAAAPALTILHKKQRSYSNANNDTNNSSNNSNINSTSNSYSNCSCSSNSNGSKFTADAATVITNSKNMPRHKSFVDCCFNNTNNNNNHVTQFSRSCVGSSKYLMNAHLNVMSDDDLVFESRFESGNLAKAIKITPVYYELYLRPDLYTNKHTQWFYFRVTNVKKGFTYR